MVGQLSTKKLFTTLQRYEEHKKKHRLRRKRSERKRTCMGKRRGVASLRCTNEQSTKQPAETEGDHCKSGKNMSIALARYSATVLSATGHKALKGTWCALALFHSFVPFGTEPLLVNTEGTFEP